MPASNLLLRMSALSAVLISAIFATVSASGQTAPQYFLTDLGALLNQTTPPTGVGGSGFPGTGSNSFGIGMNENGDAIGVADAYISEEYQPSGGSVTAVAEDPEIGFIYDGTGVKQALLPIEVQSGASLPSSMPNDYCYIGGLNATLQAVGATNYEYQADGRSIQHAMLWSGATTTDLGALWDATAATQSTGSQADDTSDALAISDAGEIVGYGTLASTGESNAFTYKSGVMTDITAAIYAGEQYNTPASTGGFSRASGINKNGLIIGDHYFYGQAGSPDSGVNGYYPFLYDPSTGVTTPLLSQYGYTDSLNVIGDEENGDEMGASLNDSGDVAFSGLVPNTGQATAVLYGNGVYTDIGTDSDTYGNSYATYDTWTHAIGDSGDVVGCALIPVNAQHHFSTTSGSYGYVGIVWHGGNIYNLNDVVNMPPGYYILDAKAIDPAGDILATAETIYSGFRAVLLKHGMPYTITDLGASSAVGINASGQVVGSGGLWTPTTANAPTSTTGFVSLPLMPSAINIGGQIAGTVAADVAGQSTVEAALWSPIAANGSTGTLTTFNVVGAGTAPGGSDPPLITNNLFGVTAQANGAGINSDGTIVGESSTNNISTVLQSIEEVDGTDDYTNDYYDVVAGVTSAGGTLSASGVTGIQYQSGVGINIEAYPTVDPSVTPPPFADCPGFSGINDDSETVGWNALYFEQTLNTEVQENNYDSVAVFVNGTTSTTIPTLDELGTSVDGPSQHPQDFAFAINNSANVVGQSEAEVGYGPVQHAFLWTPTGYYLDLGALQGTTSTGTAMPPGQVDSAALGVDDNGQAVGWSCIGTLGSGAHAVLWNGDTINDLNVDVTGAGWTLYQANGINDDGQIVGEGMIDGAVHGFLLTPSGTAPPVLSSISPSSAAAGSGQFTLTANGSGFAPASVLEWNGAALPTSFVSVVKLTAIVPADLIATVGTASVTVFIPGADGGTSAATTFTITNPAPALSSISPTMATAGSAAFTLTVRGSKFASKSVVRWNGVALTTTYVSAAKLTAAVPASRIATTGTASVTVFTSAPGGGTSAAATFTIEAPVPALTSISPASAAAGSAAFRITVHGSKFVPKSVVRWNGSALTTTYVSAAKLTAAVPVGLIATAGTASVTAFTPAPGGGTSAAATFTITALAPVLSSISPTSTAAGSAAFTLTVNGSKFIPRSVVRWKGAALTTTYVSTIKLSATVAAAKVATAGTAAVTVFTSAPGGGTSAAAKFTITATPAPVLSSISPTSAVAGSAAFILTVNGSKFVPRSVVRWKGVALATTYVSVDKLTAAVAASRIATAGTASVTVFTSAPGGGTSSAAKFTIK